MSEYRVGQEYRSNLGHGPLRAKIVRICGDTLVMERWDERPRRARRTTFWMQRQHIESPTCGWRPVAGQEVAQ